MSSKDRSSKTPTRKRTSNDKSTPPQEKPASAAGESSKRDDFPIIGLGASAGGFEAFSKILENLPAAPGFALVFVQHLDPSHESHLPSLLARFTKMEVLQAGEGIRIKPDHVYVIPPNFAMAISSGTLHLARRPAGPHMSIDIFFRSLADDRGSRAVGVVLSGTASDGTLGMKAIRAEGGITIVQRPETAKYDGMPRNAISAGVAQLVLSPEEIAQELTRMVSHPYWAGAVKADANSAEEQLQDEVLNILSDATRVDFRLYKRGTLTRRIARRMLINKVETLADYLPLLQSKPEEVEALYHEVLIKVTSFFRDPELFEFLKKDVFPAIMEQGADQTPVRVWVPGCATGEEAYSLSIAFLEFMMDRKIPRKVQIFATDLSEHALETARAGIFPAEVARDVSKERLRRFFAQVDRGFQIANSAREMCIFARHDITHDPPFSRLDMISCRNVLIYLGPALQKQAMNAFHYALKPNRFLLLGSSETIGALGDLFATVDKKHRVYERRGAYQRSDFVFPTRAVGGDSPRDRILALRPGVTFTEIQREVDRTLGRKYAPSSVIVDEDYKIIEFRGQTGDFLEHSPGEPSLSVLKMVTPGLATDLKTALHTAFQRNAPIQRRDVILRKNDRIRRVDIEVVPVPVEGTEGRVAAVVFHERAAQDDSGPPATVESPQAAVPEEIAALSQELAATKQFLQTIIEEQEAANEELKSGNEEIQSSNEELQSTNEELETAKEELQSANEELTTVNEELQNRNEELTLISEQLSNLLGAVNLPIVMLDSGLRIRRFTGYAETLLNLTATDVGRKLPDLNPRFDIPDFEQLVTGVVQTLATVQREVQDSTGKWHLMMIRPYRTGDNKIEGAVLTLLDIDTLKRSVEEARQAKDYAEAIVETVREALVVVDPESRVVRANRCFYQTFRLSPEEVLGRVIYDLGNGKWNLAPVRSMLEGLQAGETPPQDIEFEAEFERIGRLTLRLNARQISHREDFANLTLLTIWDAKERTQSAEARYRRLFESAKDGILVLDGQTGFITDANPAFGQLLSIHRENLVARRPEDVPGLKRIESILKAIRELRETDDVHYQDVGLQISGGKVVFADLVGASYEVVDRRVVQINLRDVSERRRTQEILRRSEEQLMRAQKLEAMGRLAGGVAHDFNNALTAILGYCDMLLTSTTDGEEKRRPLAGIKKSAERAATLTRQLLAVGGRQVLRPRTVDLNECIADMGDVLRRMLGDAVDFTFEPQPGLFKVKIDPAQLEQVLVNMAANAREAMPEGGRFTISTANVTIGPEPAFTGGLAPGDYASVTLSDTGVGMDEETKAHIFEPFFSTRPHGPGSGLGLSTVYGFVQQSGGTVMVDSRLGQGSRFTFYLPAAKASEENLDSEGKSLRGTILVTEDEAIVLELVGEVLQSHGFEVLKASRGEEALRIAKEHAGRIDLLLTDVVIPGMNGIDLASLLVQQRPETRVLLMSGHAEEIVKKGGDVIPGAGFLPKPFSPSTLVSAVARALQIDGE